MEVSQILIPKDIACRQKFLLGIYFLDFHLKICNFDS